MVGDPSGWFEVDVQKDDALHDRTKRISTIFTPEVPAADDVITMGSVQYAVSGRVWYVKDGEVVRIVAVVR